jgi:hypothetical protein
MPVELQWLLSVGGGGGAAPVPVHALLPCLGTLNPDGTVAVDWAAGPGPHPPPVRPPHGYG